MADLYQERLGKARQTALMHAHLRNVMSRRINWTIVSFPNEGWATTVFGEPDVDRLWDDVAKTVRLDEPDPVAAWESHIARLEERARALNERHFDAIRFRGPGTDLIVGLNDRSRWHSASTETTFGRRHVPNVPTEEVFTTPDFRRAQGTVRSTMPLALPGNIIRDLELRFDGGRIVDGRGLRARAGCDRRRLGAARRARARRRHVPRRSDGTHFLQHALRRERDVSHRIR